MSDEQISNYQSTAILKELSDIKESLAINTTETANIKISISEIKGDMRDVKNELVTRREYNEYKKEIENQTKQLSRDVELLKEFRWKLAGIVTLATFLSALVGEIILKFIIK